MDKARTAGPGRLGVDLPGVAVLSAALMLLVLPLVLGQGEGWPGWTWACLAASVPAFVPEAVFALVREFTGQ